MADDSREEEMGLLLARVGAHIAFLEGALNVEMTIVFKEDDMIVAEVVGGLETVTCALAFTSNTEASGWMVDQIEFEGLKQLAAFLENVELLIRLARTQQRGG